MLIDARNLMIDRRDVADCVAFRSLTTLIRFEIEPDIEDPWRIHDWFWCIKGTRGYKKRVHVL
jgi:hypothetical protein